MPFHCPNEESDWRYVEWLSEHSAPLMFLTKQLIRTSKYGRREKKMINGFVQLAIGVWQTDNIIAHRLYLFTSKPATNLCLNPNEFCCSFDFHFMAKANYFWFATGSKLFHGTRQKLISISRLFRVYANCLEWGRCLLCETESKCMRIVVGASEVHRDISIYEAANAGGDRWAMTIIDQILASW